MTTPLDAIMAGRDEPAPSETRTDTAAPAAPAPEPARTAAQNRADDGKFAPGKKDAETSTAEAKPKETAEPPQKAIEPGQDTAAKPAPGTPTPGKQPAPDGYIPIQAHDAEKAKRRKAEETARNLQAQLRALQGGGQTPPKPNGAQPPAQGDALERFLADPDAFIQQSLAPVQQTLTATGEKFSERFAIRDHGQEIVDQAKEAAIECMEAGGTNYQILVTRLKASDHPFDELVAWHKEQQQAAKIGGDPDAYIASEVERLLAERLATAQTQPPAAAKPDPKTLPTPFAKTPSAAPRAVPGAGGPKPLSEIMGGR